MQTITILSRKGGTGKSTTALSIAGAVKELKPKTRILLVDLDSQANLTLMCGGDPSNVDNAYTFLTRADNLSILNVGKYDLIGGSIKLAVLDTENSFNVNSLKENLSKYADKYDLVIIDTPAQYGRVTLASITASDHIIETMLPDLLSLQGIKQTRDILEEVDALDKLSGFLVTRYNSRITLNNLVIEELNRSMQAYNLTAFNTKIRTCNALNESTVLRQDIFSYKRRANACEDYLEFVKELKKRKVLNV